MFSLHLIITGGPGGGGGGAPGGICQTLQLL